VTDIKPPDFETRVAILRKKAEDDQIPLADEVLDFIAGTAAPTCVSWKVPSSSCWLTHR